MKPKELIAEAISLPVEARAIVVHPILRSLNSPEHDINRQWIAAAEQGYHSSRTHQTRHYHPRPGGAGQSISEVKGFSVEGGST